MTIRDKITGRLVWLRVCICLGVLMIVVGGFLFQAAGQPAILPLIIVGGALIAVTMILAQLVWLRCPICRGNMGPLILHRGVWNFDSRIRYCPYCAASFDEEILSEDSLHMDDSG